MSARAIFGLWAISRLWHATWVYLGHRNRPFLEPIPGGFEGVTNWWLNPWTTYDSEHFLAIAARGYEPMTSAFFPLYPLLLRPFGPDPNALALAGVVISNLCFLGALVIVAALTRRDYGERAVRPALVLLAFFPLSAASMAVYTESLWLLLGTATWWLAGTKARGARANAAAVGMAVCAFGAALTRNAGPVLWLALMAGWFARGRRGESWNWPQLAAAQTPLLAFVGVNFYFSRLFEGSTLDAQSAYFRAWGIPFEPLGRDIARVLSGQTFDIVTILSAAACLAALALILARPRRMPLPDAILLGGVMLLHLTLARQIPPYTVGALRYVFGLWPFSQEIGRRLGESTLASNHRVRALGFSILLVSSAVFGLLWGAKEFLS